MTILTRLAHWKERGTISPEQHVLLAGLSRGEPYSVFLELNILLYVGVLAFVGGLGWTISMWSQQMGDVLLVALLTGMFGACLWYCFSRGPKWAPTETPPPSLVFDYVLYFGSLIWMVELAYIENRFAMLSGQLDLYLLVTAGLYFFLAYRFDNRFVLSLALTSLAGYFGLTLSHWSASQDAAYRQYAIVYSFLVGGAGAFLEKRGVKPHFYETYLHIAANVLFWALLSGVFQHEGYGLWFVCLLVACGASLARGLQCRQFAFVAYAAVYGYVGVSSMLLREMSDFVGIMGYFLFTGAAMLVGLVVISRRFGREQ